MEMQDRTVVVTGGASGIGKATAFLLAREGALVFVGDVDETGGRAVAAEAAGEGLAIEFLPLDLTQTATIAEFAATVHRRAERVDGLVNGAGWDRIQPFLENPPEMWDQLIQINLMGAIRLTRALLPPMVAAQQGKIVNISSDAGRVGSTGETVYAAAKGGLIAFTKSLARELARYHINVNCVCPGPTDTPLFQRQPDRMREALTRAIPFRRIAQPQEIAEAVMFFLGRRSDYITGQVLSVSGGVCLAAAGLIAAAAPSSAQAPANQSADQNVRASQQYEQALCTNPAFRAKRIAQECGPITDPQLHQSCVASLQCGVTHRRSNRAPPSETIR